MVIETTRPKKAYIITFGCQMNEYDSDRALRLLESRGYHRTVAPEEADLIFLNTCSIREKAVQKLYSLLGRLRPLKEKRPDLILGVGGCVAQQMGKQFLSHTPYLDFVLGTHGIQRLPEIVHEVESTGRQVCYTQFDYDLSPPPILNHDAGALRAFLTIMQGCDNYCAYCVVPYVRGRETSREPEEIITEATDLLQHGTKEITLLGQNVNSYGRGLSRPVTFSELLGKAASLEGLQRLRFTTSHPKDLSPELIRVMADVEEVCEHLHLPLQSGSNRILKSMGRGYSREKYLELVYALKEALPDIALTTDIIVGFPGETEDDFCRTMDLVEEVRYDGMFSFKYSDRPMTRASGMDGKLDEVTKSRRLAELQTRQKEISSELNQALIGKTVEVLVEGVSGRYPGQLMGRTRGNKIVNFNGPESLIGSLVKTEIVEGWANSLVGRQANGGDNEGFKRPESMK